MYLKIKIMTEEELIKHLVKQLIQLDTVVQYEYMENGTQYLIDAKKEGNKVIIEVSVNENKDKKDFEAWLKKLDDNLFAEVLEEIGDKNIFKVYETKEYKKVIDQVKQKTKEIANRKIKELQALL